MKFAYEPNRLPVDPTEFQNALREELWAIKRGLESAIDYSEQRYLTAPPARVRPGMIVLADGVQWQPDGVNGEGEYVRNAANTAWRFIGQSTTHTKKLTGTTAATQGAEVTVAHGLTASKIISVTGLVSSAGFYFPLGQAWLAGREVGLYVNTTNIHVSNSATNSGSALSEPFVLVVTYEE